jgi:hypothetical protein
MLITSYAGGYRLVSMHRVAAVVGVFVLGLALGASLSRADPAPLSDPFFFCSRPAEYDSVAKTGGIHVTVRTPDGGSSYISCTLYQPAKDGVAAPGKYPGIVMDYLAYHLVDFFLGLTGHFDFFPQHGYNVINCDVPGAGSSPGVLDQFGPAETLANYDLIEWFAVQPYSTSRMRRRMPTPGLYPSSLAAHKARMWNFQSWVTRSGCEIRGSIEIGDEPGLSRAPS